MKKIICSLIITVSLILAISYSPTCNADKPVPVINASVMPILESSVIVFDSMNNTRWLGSGSFVYQTGTDAYVLTCAHLFDGDARKECAVKVYYKNGVKLEKAVKYKAEVLGINHYDDLCFLKIPNMDYQVPYIPIASLDYKYVHGKDCFSAGCPQTFLYLSAFKTKINEITDTGMQQGHAKCPKCGGQHDYSKKLVQTYNGSIGGESGGGLYDGKNLIGVCSRCTDSTTGTGWTAYVTVSDIHLYAKKLGIEFILDQPSKLWDDAVVHTSNGVSVAKEYIGM